MDEEQSGAKHEENVLSLEVMQDDSKPADEQTWLELALAQDRLGNYQAMLEAAEQAMMYNPGSALALACKARALQKLERISEATIANDQALLLNTNLPLAWVNRSGLQIIQERFPEGLRSADRAI